MINNIIMFWKKILIWSDACVMLKAYKSYYTETMRL